VGEGVNWKRETREVLGEGLCLMLLVLKTEKGQAQKRQNFKMWEVSRSQEVDPPLEPPESNAALLAS
jgi:hypothetical protein